MLIERPPEFLRKLFPDALHRIPESGKRVYLTFDDGPIPEATPEILDILAQKGVKATFFMVGDNCRKYPDLAEAVREAGHSIGNHTMHHVKALPLSANAYEREVTDPLNAPGKLFRPPHGWIRRSQWRRLRKKGYRLVLYDLVTRDYSKRLDAGDVLRNVKKYTRPGSIIVFHDSLKSIDKLRTALPEAIDWLISEGYDLGTIDEKM